MIDATAIFKDRLFQGGRPPMGPHLKQAGFDMVVLCAQEYQPPHFVVDMLRPLLERCGGDPFPGVEVVYAPNNDLFAVPPTRAQIATAIQAAGRVAQALSEGKKVLVTCQQGRNRSGLVSALALHKFTGMSGRTAIGQVKARRRNSLTNPHFFSALMRVPSR